MFKLSNEDVSTISTRIKNDFVWPVRFMKICNFSELVNCIVFLIVGKKKIFNSLSNELCISFIIKQVAKRSLCSNSCLKTCY